MTRVRNFILGCHMDDGPCTFLYCSTKLKTEHRKEIATKKAKQHSWTILKNPVLIQKSLLNPNPD